MLAVYTTLQNHLNAHLGGLSPLHTFEVQSCILVLDVTQKKLSISVDSISILNPCYMYIRI